MKYLLPVTLLMLAAWSGFSQFKPDAEIENATAEAREISGELAANLKSMLGKELAAGSFEGAVKVCSETALQSTQDFAEERGRYVRRVSLKNRNPNNVPDDFERQVLRTFDRLNRAGGVLRDYTQVVEGKDGPELRLMRPLKTGGMCLTCHGPVEKIPDEVRAVLRDRYPSDRATGYHGGEIRGAISVKIPLRR